jgi:protein SCO1/2
MASASRAAASRPVSSRDGTISQYFTGAHVEPRDLRLALVQASGGEVGTVPDRIALICSHFDPVTGRYTGAALALVRTVAVLALLLLAALIAWPRNRAGRRP